MKVYYFDKVFGSRLLPRASSLCCCRWLSSSSLLVVAFGVLVLVCCVILIKKIWILAQFCLKLLRHLLLKDGREDNAPLR